MANFQPLHRLNRENAYLYLNDKPISGAQSVTASWNSTQTNIKYLGMQQQEVFEKPIGPQVGTCVINSFVVGGDPFINFTGENGVNGFVLDPQSTSQNYSFTSGFLTSYNSRASIDSIPEISTTFSIVGDMGNLPTGAPLTIDLFDTNRSNLNNTGVYSIADPNRISISLDDANLNRVLNYDLVINVDRNSFYAIGNSVPTAVKINYPIEVNATFQFEIDNYDFKTMKSSPCKDKVENLTIGLNKYQGGALFEYNFSGMKLVAESYSANTQGNIIVDATYRTFLKKLDSSLSPKATLPQFAFDSAQNQTTGTNTVFYDTGICDIEIGNDPEFCVPCLDDSVCGRGICTPTPSNSASTSNSSTASSTVSDSNTPTPTVSESNTPSNTASNTPSATSSNTRTPSVGSTPTPTTTATATNSLSASTTASATASNTPSNTPSESMVMEECFDDDGFPKLPNPIVVTITLVPRSDCHNPGERFEDCDGNPYNEEGDPVQCGYSIVTLTLQAYATVGGNENIACGAPKTQTFTIDTRDPDNPPELVQYMTIEGCCCASRVRASYISECPRDSDCKEDCGSGDYDLTDTYYCPGCCPENGVPINVTG